MTTAKQHHTFIGIIILLSATTTTTATADDNIIIKAINPNVTVEKKNFRYDVAMDENNHSWDNQPTPLFEIILTDPKDSIQDLDNCVTGTVFKYEVKQEKENHSYILYAVQSFDYETQRRVYDFNIQSTFYPVTVKFTIINIDDENPTLTPPQCRFEEKRLYNKSDSPCKCVLQDPDGWLAKTTFTLEKDKEDQESYNISDLFGVEFREVPEDTVYRADVYVTLKKQLDYDDKIYYLFNIRAEDSAHNPTTPEPLVGAFVNVQNVRSRPPVWRNGISFYTLPEKSVEHITVKAMDGDTGINAKVHYGITYQDHKEEKYISIDASTGVITINQIDRDKYDLSTYNFTVKAYVIDEKVPGPWETPLNITLFVTDIDDNPPLFKRMVNRTDPNKEVIFDDDDDSPKVLDISFLENYNQSFYINLFLQDIDTGENAQFNVKLVNTNESFDFTAAFMVMPNEGYRAGIFDIAVQDKKHLDYEDADWRYLEFEVQTTGTVNETKSDILQVHVTLIDYNDEYPIFENTSYMTHINETAKKGTNIIQVMATDRDAEDYVLNHELVGSVNVLELIDIANETGMIFVKKDDAFDYDTLNPIFVQVKATDKVGHEATVPVTINLDDVNNKAPTITNDNTIQVKENQAIGTVMKSSISAKDPDTTAVLIANIDWENSYAMKNAIKLDMTDIEIAKRIEFLDVFIEPQDEQHKHIVIKFNVSDRNIDQTTPDFELFDTLRMNLVVTDLKTDPEFLDKQSTSTVVLISIIDINDNTPYFPEMFAEDKDKPNRTVTEDAEPGTAVGVLKAFDLDIHDKLEYNCSASVDEFDWITVDPSSGELKVKGAEIDADTNQTYYFNYTCWATDSVHLSIGLEVPIYILDVNNKNPSINLTDGTELTVDEQSEKDTVVYRIPYHDEDRDPPYHTVHCQITTEAENTKKCHEQFYISNTDNKVKNEGSASNIDITVKNGGSALNRDTGDRYYNCTADCTDNPNPSKADDRQNKRKIPFSIKLLDINNNDPILVEPGEKDEYEKSESLKKGLMFQIIGKDIDEGLNAAIIFNLTSATNESGEDCKSLFEVEVKDDKYIFNETCKRAYFNAKTDLEGHYGTYNLDFGLHDQGEPVRWTMNKRKLVITKWNYVQPRFIFPEKNEELFTLFSEQTPNSPLVPYDKKITFNNFYASDSKKNDTCSKWDIKMSLDQVEPKDTTTMFKLERKDKCEYQLQANQFFKKEDVLKRKFKIHLKAWVKEGNPATGEEPYDVESTIYLTFMDNDQQPIFDRSTSLTFTLLEADKNQYKDLDEEHSARYPGGNIGFPINYFLVEEDGNPATDYFKVNMLTGQITLKQELEYLKYKEYDFYILASNDSSPATSTNELSKLQVFCNVEEINKYPPEFKTSAFYGAILTTSTRGAVLVTLEATDRDEIDQGNLNYSISGNIEKYGSSLKNIDNPFSINSQSGQISLNFDVDDGMAGYFKFQVMVADKKDAHGNGPHNDTASTRVFIITNEYIIRFRFRNDYDQVKEKKNQMLEIIQRNLKFIPNIQSIGPDPDIKNQAFVSFYYIDQKTKVTASDSTGDTDIEVVKGSVILRKVGDISIYQKLYQELYAQEGLVLLSFPSDATSDDLDATVRSWLIGISVVLSIITLALLVALIIRSRQLNNRIKKLTERRFSDELGVNKLDIAAPNTNKHAVEANPIFRADTPKMPKDSNDFEIGNFDRKSIVSGDSDLIGVEDSPEFDQIFTANINEATNYI